MEVIWHNENLFSIKGYLFRTLFYKMLTEIPPYNNLYLVLSRPDYSFDVKSFDNIIWHNENYFEAIVALDLKDLMNTLSQLETAWNSFEFVEFLIVRKSIFSISSNLFKNSPEVNSALLDGVSVHKGIEEDVVWFAKTENLKAETAEWWRRVIQCNNGKG